MSYPKASTSALSALQLSDAWRGLVQDLLGAAIDVTARTVRAGTEVWCSDTQYPRILTEMVNGKAERRCACFEKMGWNDMRQVYRDCKPDAHRCKVQDDQAKL